MIQEFLAISHVIKLHVGDIYTFYDIWLFYTLNL